MAADLTSRGWVYDWLPYYVLVFAFACVAATTQAEGRPVLGAGPGVVREGRRTGQLPHGHPDGARQLALQELAREVPGARQDAHGGPQTRGAQQE